MAKLGERPEAAAEGTTVMNTDDQLVADYLRRLTAAAASLPPDRRDELIEEISAHITESRAVSPDTTGEGKVGTGVADTLARLGDPGDIVRAAAEQADPRPLGGPADAGLLSGDPAGGGSAGVPAGPFGGPRGVGGEPIAGGPTGSAGYWPGGYAPGGPGGPGRPGGTYPGWPGSYGPPTPPHSGMGVPEIAAVILLLIGGFLAGIGWIVGVVLLWISPRWRLSDKLLGTLIWPGGVAIVLFVLGAAAGGGSLASPGACSDGGLAAVQMGNAEPATQSTAQHCTSAPATLPGWLGVTLMLVAAVAGIGGPVLVAIRLVRQARREQQAYPSTA
jgi:hypothetical protein